MPREKLQRSLAGQRRALRVEICAQGAIETVTGRIDMHLGMRMRLPVPLDGFGRYRCIVGTEMELQGRGAGLVKPCDIARAVVADCRQAEADRREQGDRATPAIADDADFSGRGDGVGAREC